MNDAERADSYGLVLPVEWVELPVEAEPFRERAKELRRRVAEQGADTASLRRLDLLSSQVLNEIAVSRLAMAAIWSQPIEDEDGEKSLLLAACGVAPMSTAELSPDLLSLRVDHLVAGMGSERSSPDDNFTLLEPPAVVQLEHAGEAVRVMRLYEVVFNVMDRLRYYSQSYLVPHDDGTSVVVVHFSTPNVEEASMLEPLFDAIANTLRIFHPGEPTDFGESLVEIDGERG